MQPGFLVCKSFASASSQPLPLAIDFSIGRNFGGPACVGDRVSQFWVTLGSATYRAVGGHAFLRARGFDFEGRKAAR